MFFKQIKAGPMQNFCYLIGDDRTKECAVVDAGWGTDEIVSIAEKGKLKINKIILTHCHFDHAQKVDELAQKTKATVYFHEDDFSEISRFIKSGSFKIVKLKGDEKVSLGNTRLDIIHVPGHTPGGISILVENKLLTGDTLFVNAIGRTDLAGGDASKLYDSLQKLKKLDDATKVYPGHDYGEIPFSTIGNEKKNNPYLMCESKEQFFNLLGLF